MQQLEVVRDLEQILCVFEKAGVEEAQRERSERQLVLLS